MAVLLMLNCFSGDIAWLMIFYFSMLSTDLVCQSGPGSWPSLVYAESAIYPMAHSAAQVLYFLAPIVGLHTCI